MLGTRYLELELESDHVRAVDTGQTLYEYLGIFGGLAELGR